MNKKSITIKWESPTRIEELDSEFAHVISSGLAAIIKDLVDEKAQGIRATFKVSPWKGNTL